jgi:hypothetical protein
LPDDVLSKFDQVRFICAVQDSRGDRGRIHFLFTPASPLHSFNFEPQQTLVHGRQNVTMLRLNNDVASASSYQQRNIRVIHSELQQGRDTHFLHSSISRVVPHCSDDGIDATSGCYGSWTHLVATRTNASGVASEGDIGKVE